jgi:hypothetical protein
VVTVSLQFTLLLSSVLGRLHPLLYGLHAIGKDFIGKLPPWEVGKVTGE